MCNPLPFLPHIKRVEVGYLGYLVSDAQTLCRQCLLQLAAGIALQVGKHALLVRGRIGVHRQTVVEPDTTVAVVGIALAAERRMVELQQLPVGNIEPAIHIAHRP